MTGHVLFLLINSQKEVGFEANVRQNRNIKYIMNADNLKEFVLFDTMLCKRYDYKN